jgi:hypothetical protein
MLTRYLAVSAEQIRSVAADVFRSDNRIVLTYLPELPPAETAAATEEDAPPADATDAPETADDEEVAA